MNYTVAEIAKLLNGEIDGDANAIINTLSKIEEGGENSLSFLANPKYEPFIYNTTATAVILNKDFVPEKNIPATIIKVDNAYAAFAKLLEFYNKQKKARFKISRKAKISRSAKVSKNNYIAEFVYVGNNVTIGEECQIYPNVSILDNVKIGNNVTLYPNVTIMHDCEIGNNCIIHSGTVIGSDGFGFAPISDGKYAKIPQTGNVILEDNVEIGGNTCIDRATIGSTIIRKGAKIDNLVQIAHNVEVGADTVIAGQTGISGSTKIGSRCMFGGQVGVAGHISIANNTKVGAQSGISSTVKEENTILMGSPAFDAKKYRVAYIHYKNLDRLSKKVDELEKKLKEFEK
jgi:UDP-3-O-[3-hydroxymyristoyl] glucosamine N-acyltransferase